MKPYQPQPVQPTKPATGAPVASAREQVIDQKAERERMEREIRAELERERAEAARAKAATQTAQTAAVDGGRYMMQCAALRSQDSAESLKARIAFTAGLSSSLQVVNRAGGAVYKVMVGPFNAARPRPTRPTASCRARASAAASPRRGDRRVHAQGRVATPGPVSFGTIPRPPDPPRDPCSAQA